MHNAVGNDDIRFDRARPFLPVQLGEQSIPDQAVTAAVQRCGRGGRRGLGAAR
jgi:hypothetical protein